MERMPEKGQQQVSFDLSHQGLPEELSEFLSKDTYSLLIKGGSGTGKTILALSILKSLLPIENPLYLTTRTSPLQLIENYPWAEEIFGEPRASGAGRRSEEEGWETLVDARLDEPDVVFERITDVLMDKDAPTVVIDSWESLSDTLGSEALRTNFKVLQTWRERAGARFIFIGEDPANTAIDSMVEGIVVLKDRVTEGRRLREAVLSKLHGVRIAKPSYFFTLQGGTFASIPGYSPQDYEFRNPLPVRFDRPFGRKSRVPTGYAPLDGHLGGGLPLRSETLVEVDKNVDPRVGLIFLSRTVQEWLARGGTVALQRPEGVDRRFLSQYSKSFAAEGGRLQLVEGIEWGEKVRGRPTQSKTLAVVCGREEGRIPAGHASPRPDLLVELRKEGTGADAGGRQAVRLRLQELEGTLFVRCDFPLSAIFAVVPGMTAGNPIMRLETTV